MGMTSSRGEGAVPRSSPTPQLGAPPASFRPSMSPTVGMVTYVAPPTVPTAGCVGFATGSPVTTEDAPAWPHFQPVRADLLRSCTSMPFDPEIPQQAPEPQDPAL